MRREILVKSREIATPFYLYDRDRIIKNIAKLTKYFSRCNARIFFAVKANTSLSVLEIIRKAGVGAEVVSPGEVFICLKAGFAPKDILYNNIARKEEEVLYAVKKGVVYYNFEAIDQALLLEKCARRLKREIKLFARINPGIFPETHPHLSTGARSSKFGIECERLEDVAVVARRLRWARFVGIHSHIGSQILSPTPFIKGVKKVRELIEFFRSRDIAVEYINLGGGFGIPYHPKETELDFKPIVRAYKRLGEQYRVKIFLEPGRFLVGNAGYIIATVISVKQRQRRPLYIIDAGMTENPRPALYNAYHHIEAFFSKKKKEKKVRVAGPLCENSDEFGLFSLPPLKPGDRVIIHNCGAYTRTMASNYNGRLLPAEYLYDRKNFVLIRKREQFRTLINNELY